MKAVHVMFDENLLAKLDETAEVRERGRSAVLRELTSDFLRHRREQEADAQYERAYSGVKDPLGEDFEGWDEEGVWSRERALRALDALLEDDEAEQRETFAFLKESLDHDPPSNRKRFSCS